MICPKCETEITTIRNVQSGFMNWELNKEGNYKQEEFEVDNGRNSFDCPNCNETIASNEEEAIQLLNKESP